MGSVRRNGAIIAMSSGLVASMALPAHAVSSAPVDASGPQTASMPAVPATGAGVTFFAAPEGGLLALPPDLAAEDGPVSAPAAATVDFDHTAFVAVPAVQRVEQPAPDSTGTQGEPKVTTTGDGAAPPTRRVSRTTTTGTKAKPAKPVSGTSSDSTDAAGSSVGGSQVLAIAARYLGVKYLWGGTTARGFDCSGYTQYVYGLLGKHLPRTVAQQRSAVKIVSRSQARPGDLVIFGTSHIGIYAGGNKMYDAPHTGMTVTLREIYTASVVFGRVG